jgi:hypothetical protein
LFAEIRRQYFRILNRLILRLAKRHYHTDWLEEDELPLKLEGLNVDAVYENFVRHIAGDKLKTEFAGESLKESVARDE